MLRRLLLPALAIALFAAEAASAQTVPAVPATSAVTAAIPTKKEARQAARATRRAGRVLTNREKRAAAAAAKAAATPTPTLAWSGPDVLPENGRTAPANRTDQSWSSAPGMPLNQVGHGVTTDYDGRPVRRPETANTTLPTVR